MDLREKHIEVLDGLIEKCVALDKITYSFNKTCGAHMIAMIEEIKRNQTMPIDKIARWTGFIQGVLAARGVIDVDAERDRTRPIFNRENR